MGVAVSQGAKEAMARPRASADSLVIGPQEKPVEPMVIFYQLGRKFVDNEQSVPERSSEIMYYTLAVGHHTGVIDCFDEKLACSVPCYRYVCGLVPEGAARYKLSRILESGEIQVDQGSVSVLSTPVKEALAKADSLADDDACDPLAAQARDWLQGFDACLEAMKRDRALYYMGRSRLP